MNGRDTSRPTNPHEFHDALADGGFDDAFFRTAVDHLGVGVGVYDETGTFAYANDALAALLGREPSALVGRTLWDVNPEVAAERFEEYWDSFDVGESREREARYVDADGEPVPVETVTTAIEVDGAVYHVGTVVDAADRVADWEEMERQDERLSEIASVISHDLRNPLNVAMGRAELAAMDADSEHLDYVERSLEKMEALITDVLTMTRKGSRLTDPEPTGVAAAATTAWYEAEGADAASMDVVDDLGTVQSTEDRLTALFDALFENALEHAGPDVAITVGPLPDGFYVADDGPGVPADEREQVFEYGYTTTEGGTGFGLTIVEHVAAAHDWTVAMTESEDGGARVEVRGVDFVD